MDVSATGPPQGGLTSNLARSLATIPHDVLHEVAKQLGIGVGQLRAEIASGKPLSDLAAVSRLAQAAPSAAVVDEPHGEVLDVRL